MSTECVINKEEIFHDNWAATIDPASVMVDQSFEACTAPENRAILNYLGDLKNKEILELGCGAGEASVFFAKKGARVIATDVSTNMLELTKKVAAFHGVSLQAFPARSDRIPCPDNSFDIVYAANILHHVNIQSTLKEIKRVLKPGGAFVGWDPLAHNPAINVYRWIATEVRTEDEHPIRFSELKYFKKEFISFEFQSKWFFTLFIFLKFFFLDRINPNKERYWKKIISEHQRLKPIYLKLEKIDSKLLKIIPFLRRFCWNIVFFCKK